MSLDAQSGHRVPAIHQEWRALLQRGVDLYVELVACSASIDGRPAPDIATARRPAELCKVMVGHALHNLYRRDRATERA